MNAPDIMCTDPIRDFGEANDKFAIFVNSCLFRFIFSDWGDLDKDYFDEGELSDWELNDQVVDSGKGRIHAVYDIPEWTGVEAPEGSGRNTIWIMAYAIGNEITVLFPSDY